MVNHCMKIQMKFLADPDGSKLVHSEPSLSLELFLIPPTYHLSPLTIYSLIHRLDKRRARIKSSPARSSDEEEEEEDISTDQSGRDEGSR